ncbi:MAG: formate--tetrahydrofolate ligase [Candidatus Eisenbacteria bacterium]|uniref:Formate--tetrahydrofolate ligase n=1 Tax=Eiseniibacteriota bacterium TaxID=2212470 RepID=A0A849SNI1_UNCEI|nr:formate--tetrahydrofolate ligase [Candidatus Eisenbacteria bacterium]
MRPILEIARQLELDPEALEPYGRYKAKIPPAALAGRVPRGALVLVSAITPTPAGEGKTTTSVGLSQGLAKIGMRAAVALREPSLGPFLGMKGGGTGGGASQVVPSDDINLHFTGDIHAVTSANNLLAAMLDNHLHHGNQLGLDSRRVIWRRAMDMNDRALRFMVSGLGGRTEGVPRETGFDISAASEVMAVLCLASDIGDLKTRLARIVVGFRSDGSPVTAANLKAVGAMCALLKDAIKPNLVQTVEGVPAFIHGGPFANIAHGTNSIAATRMALSLADIVVTEAGFAFELGAEKFFDINCRYGGFAPSCTVLVATLRALKMHGGVPLAQIASPDVAAVERGLANLDKHLENIRKFEQPCVVAINHFPTDTVEEAEMVRRHCAAVGIEAVPSKPFTEGGDGCRALAEVVRDRVSANRPHFRPLYDWNAPIAEKIQIIAREMYGAEAVDFSTRARRDRAQLEKLGFDKLPVCIAKTQQSLSDNPALLGRPKDFLVTVREIQLAAGAGFIVPITGEILRMPGLPKEPLAERFDLEESGEIVIRSE